MARGSGSRDRIAPTLQVTSPANLSTYLVGQTITLSATATDNKAVARVEFYYGRSAQTALQLITSKTTAPYSTAWTIPNIVDTYQIVVRAFDAAGNFAEQIIYVNATASTTTTTTTTVIGTTSTTTTTTLAPLPSSVILAMPPVINQGGAEGSCTAMSETYYTLSGTRYYATNATSYNNSVNVFSPEFVFNQLANGDCSGGIGTVQALDFMVSNGACTFQSMPYDGYNGCTLQPNSSQVAEALTYRPSSWYRVLSSDIAAVKRVLFQKKPLAIALCMDQAFVNAGPTFIWTTPGGCVVAHAMAICGYDDSKNAFRVVNSAGPNWGDNGYSWIDYGVFATGAMSYYCYVINL